MPVGGSVSPALARAFYARATVDVARDLIGKLLWRRGPDGTTAGIIVEDEAYVSRDDPAAHGYGGMTVRNRAMFGPPGHAYIYLSYGRNICLNIVTEAEGQGAAVLIRAVQPAVGIELMRAHRGTRVSERDLARGPGRLCQAFGITLADYGADLCGDRLWLSAPLASGQALLVAATPRVGITRAADWLWRFVAVGSPYVSRTGIARVEQGNAHDRRGYAG